MIFKKEQGRKFTDFITYLWWLESFKVTFFKLSFFPRKCNTAENLASKGLMNSEPPPTYIQKEYPEYDTKPHQGLG